ncbi:hypothetical protein BTL55_13815 [Bordetella trematum]|uniref:ABC transporter substrate-binding protein n=2 Tax=Bordetella trematum TaxID=123899 RepID=UPI00047046A6|nr:ABC transporter substrate-binding protein [Bordetella trematum]AUL47940.1 hypothetical protein BTL55_13815 [Bordetella trematum]
MPIALPARPLWRLPAFCLLCLALMSPARATPPPAAAPIVLGEVAVQTPHAAAFRQGWQWALEEINQAGGVLQRPLRVTPSAADANAEQSAQALLAGRQAVALFGGEDDREALAVAALAQRHATPYLATAADSDRLIWQQGNAYTFRLAPSTRMRVTAVAPRALGLRARRWAILHEDSPAGREAADTFSALLEAFQSRTEIVHRQAIASAALQPDTLAAMHATRPDALLLALRGDDAQRYLQLAGSATLPVVALYADDLSTPPFWIAAGHPPEPPAILADFTQAYQARYQQAPTLAALQGYIALHSLAAALQQAGSTDAEALRDALAGLTVPSPLGPIHFRQLDHQSTMGLHVRAVAANGKPQVHYTDGARLQIPDQAVRQLMAQRQPAQAGDAPVSDTPTATARPASAPPQAPDAPRTVGVGGFISTGPAVPRWPD